MHANLVLVNGRILTMDERLPIAQGLAVAGDRILHVGNDKDVRERAGPATEIIDLDGRAVLPGFIDAHCHPPIFGRSLRWIDCRPQALPNVSQIVAAVQAQAGQLEAGQWIRGRGYDEHQPPFQGTFTCHDLDPASPKHPVCLSRSCEHAITVNSRALAVAGITRATPDPPGGKIDRDEEGELTGVLRETAMDLIYDIIPPDSPAQLETDIREAGKRYLAAGITTVHDAWVDEEVFGTYVRLHNKGELPLRFYMMIMAEVMDFLIAAGLPTGFGDPWLRVGPLKIFTDGGIGARTAALTEPYQDEPDNYGILWMEQEALNKLVLRAHRAGFRIATHAIGDRAIGSILDAYQLALDGLPRTDHRLRIEHLSLPLGDQVERVRRMGLVVVSQPVFLSGGGAMYCTNLGPERGDQMLPFRKLLNAGIPLAGSSDSPVAPFAPVLGIAAAVTRGKKTAGPTGTGQELTVEEALYMYTRGGAFAAGEEEIKGSLTAGKLADLVVLDQDPFDVHEDELTGVSVDMTVIGGTIAHQRR
jgi:predicted amidohydrolase YtcJ